MSTRESNHDEDFNSLIQRAIANQDHKKVTALIRSAIRKRKDINLTSELEQAVALGNKHLVELIYPYYKETPKLVPKIALTNISQKHLNCILFLLQNGFTVKPKDPDLRAYMHLLIRDNHDNVFIELMNHDIDVNLVDKQTGYTLLHTACLTNRMKIVKFLIKQKADVDAKVRKNDGTVPSAAQLVGQTALLIAVGTTNIPMIKFLLKSGASPNATGDILATAIQSENIEIIKILLEHGADVNITNIYGDKPLHFCVSKQPDSVDEIRSRIAKMLLDSGANVNAKNNIGCTPLFEATEYGNIKAMKVLINHKADIFTTAGTNNLLHIAMGLNNYEILELLWKRIPSQHYEKFINAQNGHAQTPLHIGSENANIKGVQLLLNNNADVNVRDIKGRSPLHIAVKANNPEITKALVEKNPDINIKDTSGQTPLHYAAKIDENGMILTQYLIEHGADVHLADYDGKVPLHYACSIKDTQIVDYLLNKGANINVQDIFRQTPLHLACQATSNPTEDEAFFELLLKNKVYINCVDSSGNSPLHYAVKNGSVAVVKVLLEAGVNINIKNSKLETAVNHVSENMRSVFNVEKNHDKIAEYLRKHIIKLKVAKFKVDEQNITLAYKVTNNDANAWIQWYEGCCKEELNRMKQTKIDNSDVTYHDILVGNSECIDFTVYDNAILGLKSNELDFSHYVDILKLRFNEALIRRELPKF